MATALIAQPDTNADFAAVTAAAKALVTPLLTDATLRRLVITAPGDAFSDLFCSAVISRLMIADRLDVEVGYAAESPTPATKRYRLPVGAAGRTLAESGTAQELPLFRDDAATVLLARARHLGDGVDLYGESYLDNHRLFDGTVAAVEIEPAPDLSKLRGRVARRFPGGWRSGRAVQTGGPAVIVEREGIVNPRSVKRSTFYRHHEPWSFVLG